jgi:hypothetical protein
MPKSTIPNSVYRTTSGGAGHGHDLAVADRGVRAVAGILPRVMSIVLRQ